MKLPFKWPFGGNAKRGTRSARAERVERAGLTRKPDAPQPSFRVRSGLLGAAMAIGAGVLVWKAVTLQFVESSFLIGQGDQRFSRVASIVAHRGAVKDRFGEPLAVSTPVEIGRAHV